MRQLRVVMIAAALLFPIVLPAMENRMRVEDSILRKATLATRETCGSAMACSVVGAVVLPDCKLDLSLQRVVAKASLRLIGTIYYFRGAFASVKERPRDRSVVNQATAINHEYAYHITPAVNAVASFLARFEEAAFPTVAECMAAGTELAKTVTATFQQALAATQARENE